MGSQKPSGGAKKLRDRILLIGAALLFILVGGAGFVLADNYRIGLIWVQLVWVSVGYFAIVGWDYRAQFRSMSFIFFFVAWLLINLLTFAVVKSHFGWLYWLAAAFVELFFFYATAQWLFGLRPPSRRGH
jgi:hypothetical protein